MAGYLALSAERRSQVVNFLSVVSPVLDWGKETGAQKQCLHNITQMHAFLIPIYLINPNKIKNVLNNIVEERVKIV